MAIAQLVQHFSVTAVLCTATQPSLNRMFQEMAPDWKIRELCADTLSLYRSFRRVTFQMEPAPLSCLELAGRLMEHHQVLCIVNTRKAAQRVYQQLSGEGNYHLSTYLYPAQRQKLIQEIRDRLAEGLPCRVVSTSLIEAGVDVDFPAVYREQAGLDSILQAAGRCNREGGHSPEESIVTVFTLEDVGDNKSIQPNLEAFRQVAGGLRRTGTPGHHPLVLQPAVLPSRGGCPGPGRDSQIVPQQKTSVPGDGAKVPFD